MFLLQYTQQCCCFLYDSHLPCPKDSQAQTKHKLPQEDSDHASTITIFAKCPILYPSILRALHCLSHWFWFPSLSSSALLPWLLSAPSAATASSPNPSGCRVSLAAADVGTGRSDFAPTRRVVLAVASPNHPMQLWRMNRPWQGLSMSRLLTMDDLNDEPPTVKKAGDLSRSRSVSSSTSYPRIPRRQSSLSASLSNDSNGPATSTRTPSLSDSLYQIEVMKIRQPGGRALRDMGNMDSCFTGDDPFVDEVTAPSHHCLPSC